MSKSSKKCNQRVNIQNRKAKFEYHFIDVYTAGIVLQGTEVKSIRLAKVSLQEAYCFFISGELWLKNMYIGPYEQGNIQNHDTTQQRKLLLKKKELSKLQKSKEKGLTIIPIRLFMNDQGFVKTDIALAKGKKLYDKRQTIKERDEARALQRIVK